MEAMQVVRSNADLHHASADAQQADTRDTSIPESSVIKTEGLQTTESVQPHLVRKDTPGVPSKLEQTKTTTSRFGRSKFREMKERAKERAQKNEEKTEGLQTTESVQPHLVQKDTPGVPSKLEQTKTTTSRFGRSKFRRMKERAQKNEE